MKCPGQDMQYWQEDAIYEVDCPNCSAKVEFYKDDTTRKCIKCGHRFVNPRMNFGCAAYCQFAAQCIGTLPEEFVMGEDSLLKDKVAVAAKRYLGNDFKAIRKMMLAAKYAERISKEIADVNIAQVLCSVYLQAITQDRTAADRLQITEEILVSVGANGVLSQTVTGIVTGDSAAQESPAYHIVQDAFNLVKVEEMATNSAETEPFHSPSLKEHSYNTTIAQNLAREIIAQGD